jgi:hypothetical protein
MQCLGQEAMISGMSLDELYSPAIQRNCRAEIENECQKNMSSIKQRRLLMY